ncbi:transcription factor GTE1 [Humulus lupulus]|uniref:transcription factor GTE1 n=1 Tax=Humulus lupulus TaxID=3486 RepID=UPI002B41259A|nr:transcription factor GTE1 [Humulus lupulus]XP_062096439.1 transcription factor GTE1 [Humulus lupulus]
MEPINSDVDEFKTCVDDIYSQVDKLEKTVNEVEQFYSAPATTANKGSSSIVKEKDKDKDKDKDKLLLTTPLNIYHLQESSQREATASKRMQELMRHFALIFRQITQHKWAWPFLEPVDVEGLNLVDYYEVIEKPMDFGTIKTKMETKDGTGYKNVREIYADVRLVFKNAMKYNDEKDDVHVMAKTLLEKFEEKWLQLLPKVAEEEKKREEEEAKALLDMKLTREAAYANMAKDTSTKLHEIDIQLRELKERVVQKCRRMSTEEKRKLGTALTRLSPEDISKALEIVAENNPNFQATAQEVDLDIDAQSEYTLWRLKVFVKEALKIQGNNASNNNVTNNNKDDNKKNNSKRRREICDALAKSKRTKKLSNL